MLWTSSAERQSMLAYFSMENLSRLPPSVLSFLHVYSCFLSFLKWNSSLLFVTWKAYYVPSTFQYLNTQNKSAKNSQNDWKTTSRKAARNLKNYQTTNNLCYHDKHIRFSLYIVASSSSHFYSAFVSFFSGISHRPRKINNTFSTRLRRRST